MAQRVHPREADGVLADRVDDAPADYFVNTR
jgi:hypothetical protein